MTSPQRIVSLVPSLTELVWWLGCGDGLIGRTRFCTEPAEMAAAIPALGGTKDPDIAAITALQPDLVITNREENRREDVEALRGHGLNVLVTDPNTVAEATAMIAALGDLLGEQPRTSALVSDIHAAIAEPGPVAAPRVLVAVWHRPFMGLGAQSYGHDLIEVAGATNVLASHDRYPALSEQELAAVSADLVLLPDEPFRFTERHVPAYSTIAPATVVDGRLLWWYGPRIPQAIRSLRALFADCAPSE